MYKDYSLYFHLRNSSLSVCFLMLMAQQKGGKSRQILMYFKFEHTKHLKFVIYPGKQLQSRAVIRKKLLELEII